MNTGVKQKTSLDPFRLLDRSSFNVRINSHDYRLFLDSFFFFKRFFHFDFLLNFPSIFFHFLSPILISKMELEKKTPNV